MTALMTFELSNHRTAEPLSSNAFRNDHSRNGLTSPEAVAHLSHSSCPTCQAPTALQLDVAKTGNCQHPCAALHAREAYPVDGGYHLCLEHQALAIGCTLDLVSDDSCAPLACLSIANRVNPCLPTVPCFKPGAAPGALHGMHLGGARDAAGRAAGAVRRASFPEGRPLGMLPGVRGRGRGQAAQGGQDGHPGGHAQGGQEDHGGGGGARRGGGGAPAGGGGAGRRRGARRWGGADSWELLLLRCLSARGPEKAGPATRDPLPMHTHRERERITPFQPGCRCCPDIPWQIP